MLPHLDTWSTTLTIERNLAHQRAERWGSLVEAVPASRSTANQGRVWRVKRPLGWLNSMLRSLHSSRRLASPS